MERVELKFTFYFVLFFFTLCLFPVQALVRFSFSLLCPTPRSMRRRTWTAVLASWKWTSKSSSRAWTTMPSSPSVSSPMAITGDLNRSTNTPLLAPSSRLALHSRSLGGVPEGAQVFDR